MGDKVKSTVQNLFSIYLMTMVLAVPYFNWRYAQRHGFASWFFFGEVVATAQAFVWPAFIFMGIDNEGSALTSEERAFAEQWNQWLDDHPEEINDLRTRGLTGDLTEKEIQREMMGLMVRFSNEADLDIPQRFIDDIKKGPPPNKE